MEFTFKIDKVTLLILGLLIIGIIAVCANPSNVVSILAGIESIVKSIPLNPTV